MDGSHFETLARVLVAACSRRHTLATAMAGVLGLALRAASDEKAAAKKKKCPPCKKRKKGTCKKSRPDGTACPGGTCHGGRCVAAPHAVCPAVCPVCQTCNPTTGHCAVQPAQNGQPGQGCAAPNACCSGTCCDPPDHFCPASGMCATCAAVCPDNCAFCATRADGGVACTGDGSTCTPGPPCASNADCAGGDICSTSQTNRITNVISQSCGQPVGTGVCWSFAACFL